MMKDDVTELDYNDGYSKDEVLKNRSKLDEAKSITRSSCHQTRSLNNFFKLVISCMNLSAYNSSYPITLKSLQTKHIGTRK